MYAKHVTHLVSFYGVRCYMDDNTGELWGVNRFCDAMIPVVATLHNAFCLLVPGAGERGFPLRVLKTFRHDEEPRPSQTP